MKVFFVIFSLSLAQASGLFFACNTLRERFNEQASGVYSINLPSGLYRAYCEMGVNGGGYTFLSNKDIQKLRASDLNILMKNPNDVMLRISKTNTLQPYTIIKPLSKSHKLSVQLSSYHGYTKPVNSNLGPYLYLGITPKTLASNRGYQGFISNGKRIVFKNCDGNPNSYFAFLTNPKEQRVSRYLSQNLIFEHTGVAVKWRRTARRMRSLRRMSLRYFLLTELHFGGCGTYTISSRWRNGDLGTAIGLR